MCRRSWPAGSCSPDSAAERPDASSLLGRDAGLRGPASARSRRLLVHAHFATDGLLALPLAEALGVPLVTTLHGYDVSRTPARMLALGPPVLDALRPVRAPPDGAGPPVPRRLGRAARARRSPRASRPSGRSPIITASTSTPSRPGAGAPERGLILHVGRLVEKKGTRPADPRLGRGCAATARGAAGRPRRGPAAAAAGGAGGALGLGDCGRLPRRAHAGGGGGVDGAAPGCSPRRASPPATATPKGLPTVIAEAAACGPAGDRLATIAASPRRSIDGRTGFSSREGDGGAARRPHRGAARLGRGCGCRWRGRRGRWRRSGSTRRQSRGSRRITTA